MDTRKFNKLIDNPDSGLLILIQQTQKHLEKGISLKLEVLEKSVLNATGQLSLDKVTPTDVNWSKFLRVFKTIMVSIKLDIIKIRALRVSIYLRSYIIT